MLPHATITRIPNNEPEAVPGLWNVRYAEIDENFAALESGKASIVLPPVVNPDLMNSWVDYGAGHAGAGYWLDVFGIVHLCGSIKNGATGVPIMTLPAGHRPANSETFAVAGSSAYAALCVESTGDVVVVAGSNAFISLSGVSFRIGEMF